MGDQKGNTMDHETITPQVGVIMGSQSDWPTMRHCCRTLDQFGIAYQSHIVSAHRTPDRMGQYARTAREKGLKVIIAGAGGAAHLPGMVAAMTVLPVIGVPMDRSFLHGLDALLSMVQMPRQVPVATVANGDTGAVNAAYLAASILGLENPDIADRLETLRADQEKNLDPHPRD